LKIKKWGGHFPSGAGRRTTQKRGGPQRGATSGQGKGGKKVGRVTSIGAKPGTENKRGPAW